MDICKGMVWNIQIIPPFDHMFMNMVIQDCISLLNNVFDMTKHAIHLLIHLPNHRLICIYKMNHTINGLGEL